VLGTASLSTCLRFRTESTAVPLLSKLGPPAAGALNYHLRRGIALAVADGGRGIGISFADSVGVSAFEELNGRGVLVDGRWHHACVVLQRATHAPSLTLYIDGRPTESRSLRATRLLRMGSLDTHAPLVLGRGPTDDIEGDHEASVGGRQWRADISEVAIWTRALLPEHVASLAARGLPHAHAARRRHERSAAAADGARPSGSAADGLAADGTLGRPSSSSSTWLGRARRTSGRSASIWMSPDEQQAPPMGMAAPRESEWMREPRWAAAPLLLLTAWALASSTLRRHRLQTMGAGLGRWIARSVC
jgi:hypothetical protein